MQKLLQVGNTYTIQVVGQEGSAAEVLLSGTAILTNCKITASIANLVQGSFVFDGNGELTSDQPVPPVPQNPELAWSAASATATIGHSNTFPTLSNPHNLAVSYTSSDTSVATVDSSGVVTLVAAGSANISASFAGNEDYYASTVTYALTVESSALPYDAEVEYLESSGTQYIDTGVVLDSTFDNVEVVFGITSRNTNNRYFGALDENNNYCQIRETTSYKIRLRWGTSSYVQSSSGAANGDIFKCIVSSGTAQVLRQNGDAFTSSLSIGTAFPSISTWLFGTHSTGTSNISTGMRFYKFSCEGRFNFIPVRVGQVGYMYETVSGQLFGNAGTGDFTIGPDKN